MANYRPRGSSLFSGLALLFVGILLLLHNYHGLAIGRVLGHWWPLILIFWGAIKLYERAEASRAGQPGASRISAGEIFLVLGLLSLLGIVVAVDYGRQHIPGDFNGWGLGNSTAFDLEGPSPLAVPQDARITIRNSRGDISVRSSDESHIRVSGKKNITAWNERDAQHIASAVSVEIVPNGDGYEVRPVNTSGGDSRVSVDMDISVPKKASLTIRAEKGDVTVSDMAKPVVINTSKGDIDVRDTGGDVTIDTRKGDVKVSDTKGNVKVSGRGGEVNVSGATGGLTIDGEFYGPIRADKIAKGVRFVSQRTDLTLTQLTGHMEAGSGNLEVADAPGNLTLRTNSYDVSIENAGGKVKVDNRNGNVEVRFSTPPKEDIEITNSSAPITISLPESSSFDIVADCHSCDIDSEFSADSLNKTSTQSGDSHLEGKYGKGRGLKITLKTSYGSISLHKTS
jgi:cell wall-active antibiotic response 4TMS protein YvqF/putative adhesin